MTKKVTSTSEAEIYELREIKALIKHMLAVQLFKSGVSQQEIGKHLRMAKSSVGVLLKGMNKDKNEKA